MLPGKGFVGEGREFTGVDSSVRVWNAASGVELALLRGHGCPVYHVEFSPDGARIISDGVSETIVWDAASGECLEVVSDADARRELRGGLARSLFRLLVQKSETSLALAANWQQPIAWFPQSLDRELGPCGRAWSCWHGSHVQVVALEGGV